MKVFLSHSSADKELARRLARDLQAARVEVWLDQWQVRVGEEFVQRIEQGLEEVDFVLVLLTRASVASAWVDREWRGKVEQEARTRRVAVVPLRGEACEIPDFLAQRSHADVSGGSYPLGLRHLLTILRHYGGEASLELPGSEGRAVPGTLLPIVTPVALEVGRDLIPHLAPDASGASRALDELAPALRDALRAELGFPFPGIRIVGNDSDMPPRAALILIDEVPEVFLQVPPDDELPDGSAAEYLFRALEDVLRRMAPSFLDPDVVRALVDSVETTAPDLVAEAVPKTVSWFELTDVLRRLVDEEVGIGDLGRILGALARREPGLHDTGLLAERARHALRGQITAQLTGGRGFLPALVLDPEAEALVAGAIQRTVVGGYLALEPRDTQALLAAVRGEIARLGPRAASVPVLVSTPEVRPFLRRLVALEFPALPVVSRLDLEPDTRIEPAGRIRLDRAPGGAAPADPGGPA